MEKHKIGSITYSPDYQSKHNTSFFNKGDTWIVFDKQKPDCGKDIFVYGKKYDIINLYSIKYDLFSVPQQTKLAEDFITHWMYVPNLPY